MSDTPNCSIYKGSKQDDMYLYIPVKDDFERIPKVVQDKMGRFVHVMDLHLTADFKLAKEDAATILANFDKLGYHIQMPPETLLNIQRDVRNNML